MPLFRRDRNAPQDATGSPMPADNPVRQRPDCPHLPHDGPCGAVHDGPCAIVHPGRSCAALHPICPGCHTAAIRVHVPSIVHRVHDEGEVTMSCSTCEKRTFRYDAEVICATCDWLVPHANDILAERYDDNTGTFAAAPGACPGCGHAGAAVPVSFPITCPQCGAGGRIPQDVVDTTHGVTAQCPNSACGFAITIPATVWCPECKLNLRPLNKITEVIKAANSTEVPSQDNVKDSSMDRLARHLAALVETSERWSQRLTKQQRLRLFDYALLDSLASGDKPADEWIRAQVEVRSIGRKLNELGGKPLMQQVAHRASELSRIPTLRLIDVTWHGIGDWRG